MHHFSFSPFRLDPASQQPGEGPRFVPLRPTGAQDLRVGRGQCIEPLGTAEPYLPRERGLEESTLPAGEGI